MVLLSVMDSGFVSRSGLQPNFAQIADRGHQFNRTNTLWNVRWRLPICLTRVGCQWVVQQVHLENHIMLLCLLLENSILSKLHCLRFAVCHINNFRIHVIPCIFSIFAYKDSQKFSYELKYPHIALITKSAWQNIINATLMFINIVRYNKCQGQFRLKRPPLHCIWIIAIKQHLDYPWCKTEICWHSITPHFQDGAQSVLHLICL